MLLWSNCNLCAISFYLYAAYEPLGSGIDIDRMSTPTFVNLEIKRLHHHQYLILSINSLSHFKCAGIIMCTKIFFLQRISVPEYWNLFLTAHIWFVKWTEQVIVVYKKYYIIFILLFSPPPFKWNVKWFFPNIFKKYTHVLKYSLFVARSLQTTTARNTCAEMSINFLNNEYIPPFNSQVSPTRRMF